MRLFFLDDAGNPSNRLEERYFGFGGFSIDSSELGSLKQLQKLAWASHPELGLPGDELKFSHVGGTKKKLLASNPLHRIGWEIPQRRTFVLEVLESLSNLKSIEVIVSIVDKRRAFGAVSKEHAMRTLLERIQFSAAEKNEQYLIICDEEQQHQDLLRNVLHSQASHYVDYDNIQETILFAPSILSPGIQFADLLIGSAIRMFNYGDTGYFSKTVPYLRRNPKRPAQWQRFGLTIFPEAAWGDLKEETGGLVSKATGHI